MNSSGVTRRILANPLTTGVIWTGVGSAVYQVLSVLASTWTARLLGPESFGEFGVVQTTVTTVIAFVGPAITLTAAKFVAEEGDGPTAISSMVSSLLGLATAVGTMVTIAILLTAPLIADRAFNSPTLTNPLRIGAAALFCSLLASAQAGVLSGLGQFRRQAYINIARGLVYLSASVGLTKLYGLTGALIGFVLVNAVWVIGNQLEISRYGPMRIGNWFARSASLWRRVGKFSLPAALQGTVSPVAIWITTSLLSRQPGGLHELGIFNAANLWRYAILFVPMAAAQPLLTYLARAKSRGDIALYRRTFLAGLGMGMLAVLLAAGAILMGSGVIAGAYGAKFDEMRPILPMVVASAGLSAVAVIASPLIYTLDHMWAGVVFNVTWCSALVVACAIFVRDGAPGFARAYVIASAVQCALGIGSSIVYLRQLTLESGRNKGAPVAGGAIVSDVAGT